MKRVTGLLATTLAFPLALGCGSPADNEDTGADTGGDDDGGTMATPGDDDGGTMDGAPGPGDDDADDDGGTMDGDPDDTGGPPPGCADASDPAATRVMVSENIDGGAEWTCDTIYVLTSIVFVNGGELTIEPGTTIEGTNGSALVIDSDASITAAGTADAPIVFTSALPPGDRNRGDWGGLVLIGDAPANVGSALAEGFADPPDRKSVV